MTEKLHILDETPQQLKTWLTDRSLPAYRAAQVRKWIYERRVTQFERMTDLPPKLRSQLDEHFNILSAELTQCNEADDGSKKLLLRLHDGQTIECVLLCDDRGKYTVCLSTQVGCAMGCVFCASGLDGLERNLTSGEIIEQVVHLQQLISEKERISRVVVMGMGEPLANLDALLPALEVITAKDGFGVGARRITISTVGLPKGIRQLAKANCQYHLAVSLHSPFEQLRNELVPANRKIGIAAILTATDFYFEQTGRRVTIEYVLLGKINDRPEHARELAELMQGRPVLVNLIPFNPVAELPFTTPSSMTTANFAEILRQGGLNVKIRYRKGEKISAACGQLRRRNM